MYHYYSPGLVEINHKITFAMFQKMSVSLSSHDSDSDTLIANSYSTASKLTSSELKIVVKKQLNATERYLFPVLSQHLEIHYDIRKVSNFKTND